MAWTGIYTNGILSAVTDGLEVVAAPTTRIETRVITPTISIPEDLAADGWELTEAITEKRLVQKTFVVGDPRWETISSGIPLEEPPTWNGDTAKATALGQVQTWLDSRTWTVPNTAQTLPLNDLTDGRWTNQTVAAQTIAQATDTTEVTFQFGIVIIGPIAFSAMKQLAGSYLIARQTVAQTAATVSVEIMSATDQEGIDEALATLAD